MVINLAPLIVESDQALAHLSRDNPGYRIEREEDGTITMSPTYTRGGAQSAEALGQLYNYAKRVGGTAFDSSTGFNVGPRKKTLCPDASWISRARIDELTKLGKAKKFWPISPDVVIEVKSNSDDFAKTVSPTPNTSANAGHPMRLPSIPRPARSLSSGPHPPAWRSISTRSLTPSAP